MSKIKIEFKDGTIKEFDNRDCASEQKEGWLIVRDQYDQLHSYPSDTIKEVTSTPRPRW